MRNKFLIALLFVITFASCNTVNINKFTNNELPVSERIDYLLSIMTLDEKIGQMVQIDHKGLIVKSDVQKYFIGSVLSGGGSDPVDNMPESWANLYDNLQNYALNTRLGIPIVYGVDAVHGHNNVYGAVIFPHNIGLGSTRNPQLVEEISKITAIEVAATGIDWTFSPCIAVPQDERWGRTYEGFSEDPQLVSLLGRASIRGYQGDDLSNPLTIAATAKHYVADGGTNGGRDQGNAAISEEVLRDIHLFPYIGAVDEGVASIMASFSSWNGKKIHGNKYLLTDVLRGDLEFSGVVVSDWDALRQLPGSYENQIVEGINSGIDLVMLSNGYVEFLSLLKKAVISGKVPQERVDEAVRRILEMKYKLDLFNNPLTDRSLITSIGSKEHREVGRQAVRESLVLLKNNNNILPLNSDIKNVVVSGKSANNLGNQCGGWSIGWQGERGNDFTIGTTILDGIKNGVSKSTNVIYSRSGKEVDNSNDVAIVVIGELPYAEFEGDDKNLTLSVADIETVKELKAKGYKIVTVLISGRPMIINEVLELSDAFIAAWLPGTEGDGVADVLFGKYNPTGKLPHTWPANISSGGSSETLFPLGYGLTYEK
ncbi:MAG: glycoside hydrolase family 3 C-terminal domain-containing protein [Spirochaetales bacterium]|nr:glycoside hydrolase family 3 C-terminal domain-containing protein [Spirochaetales bacterium]